MGTTIPAARTADTEQKALWNGTAGAAWVDAQQALDAMFEPIEALLVDAAVARCARRVLDVGCGTGATTLAIARALAGSGQATGIDVSAPMIDVARARAAREGTPARFVCDDAQVHAFPPARYDFLVSRFGVMFFEDPVRAFANLRRAAMEEASCRLVAWRSAAENPFMTAAERAAAPLLPSVARRPDGPGQFAFAEPARVREVLEESGWSSIVIEPLDVACAFPEPALERYVSRMGPVGRLLHDADEATRARILDTVRPAFAPFVRGGEVRFTAACWAIDARPGEVSRD